MIPIKKPANPPKILETRGESKKQEYIDEFSVNQADYENGTKKFEFNSKIYGSKWVKNALIKAQHDKCFLCESKVTHISYGDVEHFRPKGGICQTDDEEMKFPGYFWLAYDWTNLFFACQLCNQRYKKNLFPLENPDERAFSENELKNEKPLFINPEIENPEEFISFRGEIPFAIDDNIKGRTTIKETGINRIELNEMRLETLKKLKRIYVLANLNPQIPESIEAIEYLRECTNETHQYSLAIKANLADEFRFVLK